MDKYQRPALTKRAKREAVRGDPYTVAPDDFAEGGKEWGSNEPLRVLLVDDSPDCRLLVERALRREFADVQVQHADDMESLALALASNGIDVVITGYQVRWSDGAEILRLVNDRYPACPVIMFAETRKLEDVVELMKAGLDDYVVKSSDHPSRLIAAVRTSLEKAWQRTSQRADDDAMRISEEHFRLALKNSPLVVFMQDKELRYTWVFNPKLGYSVQEVLGKTDDSLHSLEDAFRLNQLKRRVLATGSGAREEMNLTHDGRDYFYDLNIEPVRGADADIVGIACAALDITERKKAEQDLRATQDRLRFLLSTTPAMIYTREAGGDRRVSFVSDNVAAQLGYQSSDWLEDPCFWASHVHPEDASEFLEKLMHLSNGENVVREYRFLHKDGVYRWLLDDARLIRDEKGSPREIAGYLIDVTARKTAERALARQTRQLKDAQRVAQIGSWDWDLEADTLIWSDEHFHIFGVDPKEYRPAYSINMQFVHPDDRQKGMEAVDAALAGLQPLNVELRLVRADGSERYIISRGEVTFDNAGRPIRMVGTAQDITERKRADEALRDSEAKFRALAEASPALIWQLDPDGNMVYLNPRYSELTGKAPEELLGSGWRSVLDPDDASAYIAAVDKAQREQTRFQARVRVKSADSQRHWLQEHSMPLFKADGNYAGRVAIGIDITDAVRAEETLKEADRRKDEFLATLAHELRNPLAPICNAMPVIGRTGGVRAADRLAPMMERQIKHIVRLVDDLTEVSRITRGKIELRKEAVELADVVRDAIETSKPLIDNAGHRFTASLPHEAMPLNADAVRLTQVFANLLNNAARYTENGGRIWMAVYREGNDAVVSVRDSGIGISSDMLPRVFDMFTQERHSGGRGQGGLGIGLTLVCSLVKMHGGTVEAKSEGRGLGSEFTVRIPLLMQERRPGGGSDAGGAARALSGRRVLVVDDNPDVADSLAILIEFLGADVHVVHDGAAALAALDTYLPDVALLDIGMPVMDGYELARNIRRQPRFNTIKLIALTGWGQEEDRRRSSASGFDYHLTKPVDISALQALLVVA